MKTLFDYLQEIVILLVAVVEQAFTICYVVFIIEAVDNFSKRHDRNIEYPILTLKQYI